MTAAPEAPLEALRRRFVDRCAGDLAQLEVYAVGGAVSREDLHFLLHRLAGAARIFGFAAVSDLAGELEAALLDGPSGVLAVEPLIVALRAMQADAADLHNC